jgi:hypothetical protein
VQGKVHGLVTVRHFEACRTGCVARRMVRSLLNNRSETLVDDG